MPVKANDWNAQEAAAGDITASGEDTAHFLTTLAWWLLNVTKI